VTSAYDRLGPAYDAWCRSVLEDIPFYVDLAVQSSGPVLELGVGSGRVAVPTALAGISVVGIDTSPAMLALARRRAAPHHIDLRLVEADMRDLPDLGRYPLVTIPFRALLHLRSEAERLGVLGAVRDRLNPGGTLAFDVFHPDAEDISETHDRWLEREPGIWERARWDADARELELAVRTDTAEAAMNLWWVDPPEWRRLLTEAGFERIEAYGWFDRSPLQPGGADSVWIARHPG
jgi:SAM-dependent methyltransferase